jgi:hypothetical protein
MTGPVYGAAAKIAIANPLSSGPQTSAMVPPARVSGAEPKNPHRKRETSKQPMFGASAQGMLKMM